MECYSRKDVYVKRWSWLYATLIVLSLYSTVFSGIWLVTSIVQPRYGRGISTGHGWQVTPSTATLLATLGAKTIELSFVTVFVAVLGQILTRRAFSRLSRGVTLAEMTMRNWVIVSCRPRPAGAPCFDYLLLRRLIFCRRIATWLIAHPLGWHTGRCDYFPRCINIECFVLCTILHYSIRC